MSLRLRSRWLILALCGLGWASVGGAQGTSGPDENEARTPAEEPPWARGIEGQRKADLGNGFYLNPILSGDHPDPTATGTCS
jgi:xylan 1,4-beta-xylosidase